MAHHIHIALFTLLLLLSVAISSAYRVYPSKIVATVPAWPLPSDPIPVGPLSTPPGPITVASVAPPQPETDNVPDPSAPPPAPDGPLAVASSPYIPTDEYSVAKPPPRTDVELEGCGCGSPPNCGGYPCPGTGSGGECPPVPKNPYYCQPINNLGDNPGSGGFTIYLGS